jgi:two-component system response regulator BaeR
MAQRLLIVEDEADLAAIIADYAVAAGYEATCIGDGAEALASLRRSLPDLVVLDIQLPGMDGLALCKAVRAFSDVPILMVTARVEEIDRLLGLDVGADDYVCKPFSPRELIARIRAILRRPRLAADALHPLAVDEAARTLRVHGRTLDLTRTEFDLFAAMARRPGSIFSRAQLLDIARDDNLDVADRAVDSHIKNLRRKIAAALPEVEVIHSVYGLGYRVEL